MSCVKVRHKNWFRCITGVSKITWRSRMDRFPNWTPTLAVIVPWRFQVHGQNAPGDFCRIKRCNRDSSKSHGSLLNIEIPSYQYRKSHFGSKALIRRLISTMEFSVSEKCPLFWISPRDGFFFKFGANIVIGSAPSCSAFQDNRIKCVTTSYLPSYGRCDNLKNSWMDCSPICHTHW